MILAIDTEYDRFPIRPRPFIATIADESGEGRLFYLDKPKDYYIVKRICEDPKITKVFHTATNDMFALSTIDIYVTTPYHDTFIAASLFDENFAKLGLKHLAKKYLKTECLPATELNKIKQKYKRKLGSEFKWSKIPKEIMEPYAIEDAVLTIRLWKELYEPHLDEIRSLYEIELRLVPVILRMMKRGHRIDRNFCRQEIKNLQLYSSSAFNYLIKRCKSVLNPQSPKDLKKMFKILDIWVPEKTKTGAPKTDKETLKKLASTYPEVNKVLIWRKAQKQISTYYVPLLDEYTTEDYPVAHFQFYQTGAKTGRFSAELIQTIPKETPPGELVPNRVRRAFIPRPGYTNIYIDYEQIEMRLFAHFTENKSLLTAIKNGFDPHLATAIDLFGKDIVKDPVLKKECRRRAKTINFGLIYGMGQDAICEKLGLSRREGLELLRKYDQKYQIKAYMRKRTSELYRKGYIKLDWINRKYRIPKQLAYKAVNAEIQGSAAYIIKLAMIRIYEWIRKNRIRGIEMLAQVHDELVIEIHNSLPLLKTARILKELMEDHETFQVPITADVKYSQVSWLDKKTLSV